MNRSRVLFCPILFVLVLVAPRRLHAQELSQPQPSDALRADLPVGQEPLFPSGMSQVPDPLIIPLPQPLPAAQLQSDPRQLEIKRQTILLFQKMSQDRHHDLEIAAKHHKLLSGRVLSADSDSFVFRPRHSKQQTIIRYEDLDHWKQVPTEGTQVLQTTVLILITIPLFPFFFLGGLAGWQC
jgi:hypothetical protein